QYAGHAAERIVAEGRLQLQREQIAQALLQSTHQRAPKLRLVGKLRRRLIRREVTSACTVDEPAAMAEAEPGGRHGRPAVRARPEAAGGPPDAALAAP